ncbi:MAG: hypothetical protein NTW96_09635 [Planctomycetia bacterium]|nr:hypothetical protein [Planctomycetia bacterium]
MPKPDDKTPPSRSKDAEDVYAAVPMAPRATDARSALPPVIPEVVREDDPFEPEPEAKAPFQYSLADLFILTAGVALLFGVMSMLGWHWEYAAGLAGLGAFISVVLLTTYEPEQHGIRVACWAMFVFYLLTCMAAIITRIITGK